MPSLLAPVGPPNRVHPTVKIRFQQYELPGNLPGFRVIDK
jgi:hypothetical protein